MAFFDKGQSRQGANFVTESLDELMQNDSIKPSFYTDFVEGALAAVAEAEQNNTILMTAIGVNEHAYYQEHGEEIVYSEGALDTIISKVKSIIMKIWNKVKELFKRFMAMFDKFFASDKAFVKKYRAKILAADTTDLEFEGYPFTKAATKRLTIGDAEINSAIKSLDSVSGTDRSDILDKKKDLIRGHIVFEKGTAVDASEFMDKLKELYYGATEKEDLDGNDLSASVNIGYIENYNDLKKDAEKAKRDSDKAFNVLIKKADSDLKEMSKDTKNEKEVQTLSDDRVLLQFTASSIATAYGVLLNALKDRNRQGRAFCVKAMSKGGSFKQESGRITEDDGFLSNINFI